MAEGTVLVRRSALGDVVLVGAVAAHVPGPVTVVTEARWVPLVRRIRGVDDAVAWPDIPERGRVIDLQGSLRTLQRLPGARRVRKRSIRRRLRLWGVPLAPRPDVARIYAEACGVEPVPLPWIPVDRPSPDALVLAPGAAWATKRWLPAGFVGVGRKWDGPVIVIGGPGEEGLCGRVAQGIEGAEVVVERGFSRTLEVMARAKICVAGDTGLMHLAGACGVPVVALFGPTHPDDGFFVYPGAVVHRDLDCRPCTLHRQPTCPRGDHACMELGADDVFAAVEQLCAGS